MCACVCVHPCVCVCMCVCVGGGGGGAHNDIVSWSFEVGAGGNVCRQEPRMFQVCNLRCQIFLPINSQLSMSGSECTPSVWDSAMVVAPLVA